MARRIKSLPWAGLTEGQVAGLDVIISRTGYTGERVAYELFVHPDKAPELWHKLLEAGEPLGLKACGLAARDSTRTEAGLPLYGHELAGDLGLNPDDAGFGSYVKLWKPFFVGRAPLSSPIEAGRDRVVVRFRMNDKAVRRPGNGRSGSGPPRQGGRHGDQLRHRSGRLPAGPGGTAAGYGLEPGTAVYHLPAGRRDASDQRRRRASRKARACPCPTARRCLTRFPARKK